jgi:hypothetical protein
VKPNDARLSFFNEVQGHPCAWRRAVAFNTVALAAQSVPATSDQTVTGSIALLQGSDSFSLGDVWLPGSLILRFTPADGTGSLALVAFGAVIPNTTTSAQGSPLALVQFLFPGTLPYIFPSSATANIDLPALPIRGISGGEFLDRPNVTLAFNLTVRNTAGAAHSYALNVLCEYRIVSGLFTS